MPGTWGGRLMAEVWSLSAHALTLASITVSVTPRRSSRKPQPDASSNGARYGGIASVVQVGLTLT
jgi:hypothetical protein